VARCVRLDVLELNALIGDVGSRHNLEDGGTSFRLFRLPSTS
jgi:hypothetical protein